MKDLLGFAVSLLLLQPTVLKAAVLESISDPVKNELVATFKGARAATIKDVTSRPSWKCKIHGMRSRLQTYESSDFYQFSKTSTDRDVKNLGKHVFTDYLATNDGLIGKKKHLTEVIRSSQDGGIISELSAPSKLFKKSHLALTANSQKNSTVIAYTVCQ